MYIIDYNMTINKKALYTYIFIYLFIIINCILSLPALQEKLVVIIILIFYLLLLLFLFSTIFIKHDLNRKLPKLTAYCNAYIQFSTKHIIRCLFILPYCIVTPLDTQWCYFYLFLIYTYITIFLISTNCSRIIFIEFTNQYWYEMYKKHHQFHFFIKILLLILCFLFGFFFKFEFSFYLFILCLYFYTCYVNIITSRFINFIENAVIVLESIYTIKTKKQLYSAMFKYIYISALYFIFYNKLLFSYVYYISSLVLLQQHIIYVIYLYNNMCIFYILYSIYIFFFLSNSNICIYVYIDMLRFFRKLYNNLSLIQIVFFFFKNKSITYIIILYLSVVISLLCIYAYKGMLYYYFKIYI